MHPLAKEFVLAENRKVGLSKPLLKKVGISIAYTGMIERGEKIPKLETFIRIANVLEVSADLLLADVIKAQPFPIPPQEQK